MFCDLDLTDKSFLGHAMRDAAVPSSAYPLYSANSEYTFEAIRSSQQTLGIYDSSQPMLAFYTLIRSCSFRNWRHS